jgi:hypothetical protein
MTQEEMVEKYRKLYEQMSVSNDTRQMRLFGSVMNEMMSWIIKNQPTAAEAWIEKLCSIKWEQYLTKSEAAKIVAKMQPEAPWDYETWQKACDQYGLETGRKWVFNEYALWAWANALYSDQAEVIARYGFDAALADVPAEKLVTLIHAMAVSNLTDADGRFNIRAYFGI